MPAKSFNASTADAGQLRRRVLDVFRQRFDRPARVLVRAPGRVSLLGGHIDYSAGWVLPAAIDRAVFLAAAPLQQRTLTIHALDFEETLSLDLDHIPPPLSRRHDSISWRDYPRGIVWALSELGHRLPGLEVVFGSNVPMGSGVSSSAAVLMAFLCAFEGILEPAVALLLGGSRAPSGPFRLDGKARAQLGQRVENTYLGLQSGIMDPFASLHGRRGRAVFLDCRHLTYERLPMPEDTVVLVADSGVRRQLATSGFNDRRSQCLEAVEILAPHVDNLTTLRDLSRRDLELHAHRLPMELRRRAQHAVEECRRVLFAAAALKEKDLESFGALMRRSHASSRDLYEVSVPELDVLAASAWRSDGCWGARLSGGGFGGCVVALVERHSADAVALDMADSFESSFHRRPEIFSCELADGVKVENLG